MQTTTLVRSSPSEVIFGKRCSENMHKIYRRIPYRSAISTELESNFIEIALRYGCSPINLLYIFRAPFSKNTSEWLLLLTVDRKLIEPEDDLFYHLLDFPPGNYVG